LNIYSSRIIVYVFMLPSGIEEWNHFLSFVFYFSRKISSVISIRGIIDHLHRNKPFLELEQICVPNSTTCYTNSMVKLLHSGVRGAELEKQERGYPKHP
jgi:hypothetical protein